MWTQNTVISKEKTVVSKRNAVMLKIRAGYNPTRHDPGIVGDPDNLRNPAVLQVRDKHRS